MFSMETKQRQMNRKNVVKNVYRRANMNLYGK